ncbi:cysteine dioxygenase [Janibacter indicus]|uniref:Cysteine dioxygenase n=1 Tax=Janibacter indicus TaxID=857417 RepID=A0A1L3MI80_9MICO|nr:cysteine dioxygenase family protein [Janibacter indicus]APH02127.1 cysteine dioxygenase [Janibacter indicus]
MDTTSSTPALAGPTPGVEAFTPVQLLRLTQLFASDPALADTLGPDLERPGERSWRLLADSPQLQVWLIRWPVGTGTGWHDHGGARGGFAVVRGTLTEQTRERSVVATELAEGEGQAFGGSHLHDVANLGREVAVSVHAYSPTLAQMTHYDLVDGTLRPSGVEQRPAW